MQQAVNKACIQLNRESGNSNTPQGPSQASNMGDYHLHQCKGPIGVFLGQKGDTHASVTISVVDQNNIVAEQEIKDGVLPDKDGQDNEDMLAIKAYMTLQFFSRTFNVWIQIHVAFPQGLLFAEGVCISDAGVDTWVVGSMVWHVEMYDDQCKAGVVGCN